MTVCRFLIERVASESEEWTPNKGDLLSDQMIEIVHHLLNVLRQWLPGRQPFLVSIGRGVSVEGVFTSRDGRIIAECSLADLRIDNGSSLVFRLSFSEIELPAEDVPLLAAVDSCTGEGWAGSHQELRTHVAKMAEAEEGPCRVVFFGPEAVPEAKAFVAELLARGRVKSKPS